MKTRLFLATMLCATAATAHAQRLVGVVSDSSSARPLSGAVVSIVDSQRTVLARSIADETGRYSVAVGGSAAELRVERIGYQPRSISVNIDDVAAFTTRDIVLVPLATVIDTVRTTSTAITWRAPGLRAFEERRATRAAGYFIADSVLRREDGRSLSDIVLSRVSGINVIPGRAGAKYIVSSRKRCAGLVLMNSGCKVPDCYVSIYLNGSLHFSAVAGGPPEDANRIPIQELSGVEFYSTGTAPPEYNATDAGCGTLLLWSRER